MIATRHPLGGFAAAIAVALGVAVGAALALADDMPAAGRYQCSGTGTAGTMDFIVGPGNIYTTAAGRRGTLVVHPASGNVLFRGASPQDAYEGRYSAGPPAQLSFLTVSGRTSSEIGVTCRMQ